MPMSEHEQQVLDQLEQEFHASPSADAPHGWWKLAPAKRLVVAAAGVPVGLLLMLVALILNSAGGIALALVAYGILAGSVAIIVDGTSQSRAAFAQRVQTAEPSRRPWYLQ